jgi:hypothetical protein
MMKSKFRNSERISRDDLFGKFFSAADGRWPGRMPDVAGMSALDIDRRMAEIDRKLREAGVEPDPIEEEFRPLLKAMNIEVSTWGELLDLGPDPF